MLTKKIIITIIILTILILLSFIFYSKTSQQKLAQNIRILTCQPKFTNYDDPLRLKINELFLGILNYLKHGCDFEVLKIYVDDKNLEIINRDKLDANKLGKLINPNKVSGKVYYKKKLYKVNLRLKGDLAGHRSSDKQFSLKFEIINDDIDGFKEFSLTKLRERNYPDNIIISNHFQRQGLITPKYKVYKIYFNNKNWGIMLLEEQISTNFFKNRNIKEGIIYRITNESDFFLDKYSKNKKIDISEKLIFKQGKLEIDPYNFRQITKNKKIFEILTLLKSINIIFQDESKQIYHEKIIKKYFDIKKFAQFFASSIMLESFHSLHPNNLRLYFNPLTQKIEPLPTDNVRRYTNYDLGVKFFRTRISITTENYKFLFLTFLKNKQFKNYFLNSIELIRNDMHNIQFDNKGICKNFDYNCINIFNYEEFENNFDTLVEISKELFENPHKQIPFKKNLDEKSLDKNSEFEINALSYLNTYVYSRLFSNYLQIYNLTLENIRVDKINLYYGKKCEFFSKKNCNDYTIRGPFLIKSNKFYLPKKIEFQIEDLNKNLVWVDIFMVINNKKQINFRTYKENDIFSVDNIIEDLM